MRRGRAVARVLASLRRRRGALRRLVARRRPRLASLSRGGRNDGRLPLRRRRAWQRRGPAVAVISKRLLIVLTAPATWVIDRVGSVRFGRFGGREGGWPPPAGVREPRRPRPGTPSGAIALAEPRQLQVLVRKLQALRTAVSGQTRRLDSWLGRLAGGLRARARARGWA